MKVTKEEKAQNRERVIDAAAMLFREKGFDGISVADLMKKVGLTHGGFYGHFSSKEELKALATKRAMERVAASIERAMKAAPDRPLEALFEQYLAPQHRDNLEGGCLLSALGSELARQPDIVRQVVLAEQERLIAMIAQHLTGRKAGRRKQAIVVLSRLVGALTLSRAISDPEKSAEILRAALEIGILPKP